MDDPASSDIIEESYEDYTKFLERMKKQVHATRNTTESKRERLVKLEERLDISDLTKEEFIRQAKGRHLLQWRGVMMLKSSRDYCITQLMLQEIKPKTIIETGTYTGGTALWMADLMRLHDVTSHVYTIDLDFLNVDPLVKGREDITLIKGDCYKIEEALPPELLKSLPHPWYITDDAHVNIPHMLEYLDKFTQPGDYIVVEDTHPELYTRLGYGLLEGLKYHPFGPEYTLNPFKKFMAKHGSKYRVDTGYTDMFGYNATWSYNSIVCRV